MSGDNFHREVEQELNKMDKVFDFDDFAQCVKNVGHVIVMKCEDFVFENGLS